MSRNNGSNNANNSSQQQQQSRNQNQAFQRNYHNDSMSSGSCSSSSSIYSTFPRRRSRGGNNRPRVGQDQQDRNRPFQQESSNNVGGVMAAGDLFGFSDLAGCRLTGPNDNNSTTLWYHQGLKVMVIIYILLLRLVPLQLEEKCFFKSRKSVYIHIY